MEDERRNTRNRLYTPIEHTIDLHGDGLEVEPIRGVRPSDKSGADDFVNLRLLS